MTILNFPNNLVGATPRGCPDFDGNAIGVNCELRATTRGRPNANGNEIGFYFGGVK